MPLITPPAIISQVDFPPTSCAVLQTTFVLNQELNGQTNSPAYTVTFVNPTTINIGITNVDVQYSDGYIQHNTNMAFLVRANQNDTEIYIGTNANAPTTTPIKFIPTTCLALPDDVIVNPPPQNKL